MATALNIPCEHGSRITESILMSVRHARRRGFTVGRAVTLGSIAGTVIGYNIARGGPYPGARFPLLIRTDLGVGKFAVDEVTAG
jgi:hypothetical protein